MSDELMAHAEKRDVVHLPGSDVAVSFVVTVMRGGDPVVRHQADFGHEILANRGEQYCADHAKSLTLKMLSEGRLDV